MWNKMETKDLFTRELRRLAPLKKEKENTCIRDITPEVISRWACEICESVFKEDDSASSDGKLEE
jgi:hypothetical protein